MPDKVGVFICHCGGNISDYVDVERVREVVAEEPGVAVAKTFMFACSDAAQEEMIREIKEKGLDAMVVASCSPKLHLGTFRNVAQRAGLNPYTYVQVNIREQCSWAHTHQRDKATEKAIRLVRAGVARARKSVPLEPITVKTVPEVLVVGAGVAGLRAALALSELGLKVHLVEREKEVGGRLRDLDALYPSGRKGREVIQQLTEMILSRKNVVLHLETQVVGKEGSVGDFTVHLKGPHGEETVRVGAIIVATGFSPYEPKEGEFGYGHPRVITLSELHRWWREGRGPQDVRQVAFIYCVGSREKEGHTYCSRYCCAAAIYAGLVLREKWPGVRQFHLYRDVRAYGRYETLYHQLLEAGGVFLRFEPPDLPEVKEEGKRLLVRVKDRLSHGEEVEIPADLVVLVTGMVPPEEKNLVEVLKLPVGKDGFFNEVHPKLRPVETVIDGLLLAGTAQGPKNMAESVSSAMAAASKAGVLLLRGEIRLEPQVAHVRAEACTWCGQCAEACPYGAIVQVERDGRAVAEVKPALCKGEGACVGVCPEEAIEVFGYTHEQIRAMIEALCKEVS